MASFVGARCSNTCFLVRALRLARASGCFILLLCMVIQAHEIAFSQENILVLDESDFDDNGYYEGNTAQLNEGKTIALPVQFGQAILPCSVHAYEFRCVDSGTDVIIQGDLIVDTDVSLYGWLIVAGDLAVGGNINLYIGSLRAKSISTSGYINVPRGEVKTEDEGGITATCIGAGGDLSIGSDGAVITFYISALGFIDVDGDLTAGEYIECFYSITVDGGINAGGHLLASTGLISAGGDIRTGNDIIAGGSIKSEGIIATDGCICAGTYPLIDVSDIERRAIVCQKLEKGRIGHGELQITNTRQ